jgi:hypothetical protein
MPETPRGIIYPESDAHTRLWEHLQNLADSVDDAIADAAAAAALPDSGWTAVPYASGWRTSGTSNVAVRKIGKIVYMRGLVTNTAGSIPVTTSSGVVIGTIPAGFTPNGFVELLPVTSQNPGSVPARIQVHNTTGALTLWTYGAAVSYVSMSTSWVASA